MNKRIFGLFGGLISLMMISTVMAGPNLGVSVTSQNPLTGTIATGSTKTVTYNISSTTLSINISSIQLPTALNQYVTNKTNTCGSSLAKGGSCSLTFTMKAPDTVPAQPTIKGDNPRVNFTAGGDTFWATPTADQQIDITIVKAPPPVPPQFSITPTSGTLDAGKAGIAFTVKNIGGETAKGVSVDITALQKYGVTVSSPATGEYCQGANLTITGADKTCGFILTAGKSATAGSGAVLVKSSDPVVTQVGASVVVSAKTTLQLNPTTSPVSPGKPATFMLRNTGSIATQGLTLTRVNFPATLLLHLDKGTCNKDLSAGTQCQFTVSLEKGVKLDPNVNPSVSITAKNASPLAADVTIKPVPPTKTTVQITPVSPAPNLVQGGTVSYKVADTGTYATQGFAVTPIDFPSNVSFDAGSCTKELTAGGAPCEFTVSADKSADPRKSYVIHAGADNAQTQVTQVNIKALPPTKTELEITSPASIEVVQGGTTDAYSVQNTGEVDATGLSITPPKDVGLTVVDSTCGATLKKGAAPCTFKINASTTVKPGTSTITVTAANLSAQPMEPQVTVVAAKTTLQLNPTTSPVSPGKPATFMLRNTGSIATQGLTLTRVNFPATLLLHLDKGTCNKDLSAGTQCQFTVSLLKGVKLDPNVNPNVNPSVSITAKNAAPLAADVTIKPVPPTKTTVQITPVSPAPNLVQGGTVSYKVADTGTYATQGFAVTPIDFPSNVSFDAGSCTKELTAGGAPCEFTVSAEKSADPGKSYIIHAGADNAQTQVTQVNIKALPPTKTELEITSPASIEVVQGGTTDAYSVQNTGEVDATGLSITAPKGTGLTVVDSTCGATLKKGPAPCTFKINASTTAKPGTSTITVTAANLSAQPTEPQVTVVAAKTTLQLNPTTSPVSSGKPATFMLRNTGSIATQGLTLTRVNFPVTLHLDKDTCNKDLSAGAPCQFTVSLAKGVKLDPNVNPSVSITAKNAAPLAADVTIKPVPTKKTTVQITPVSPAPNLVQGGTVSYKVADTGTYATQGFAVTPIDFPSNVSFDAGSCTKELTAGGAPCEFTVSAEKSADPRKSYVIHAGADNAQTQVTQVNIKALPPTKTELEITSPASIEVVQGGTTDAYSVQNTGEVDATGLSITAPKGTGLTVVDSTCGATLKKGSAPCTFKINASTTAKPGTSTITVTASNLSAQPTEPQVNVKKAGPADLVIDPTTALLTIGQRPGTKFTVTNTGGLSATGVNLDSSTLPAGVSAYGNTCTGVALAQNQSCSFTLEAEKTASGTVKIVGSVPLTLPLTTSDAKTTAITSDREFYFVPIGGGATITITNTGDASTIGLAPESLTLKNLAAKHLKLSTNCPASLAAKASCQVMITADKDAVSGVQTTVGYTATNIQQTVFVAAQVIDVPPTTNLVVNPRSANLMIGGEAQKFVVTNKSSVALSQVRLIHDTVPNNITVVSDNCVDPSYPSMGVTLPIGASCSFAVKPKGTPGAGSLSVYSAEAAPQTVPINVYSSGGGELSLKYSTDTLLPGQVGVNYTVTVSKKDVSGIAVNTSKLPAGVEVTNNTCPKQSTYPVSGSCSFTLSASKGVTPAFGQIIIDAKDAPSISAPIKVVVPGQSGLVITPSQQTLPTDATPFVATYTVQNLGAIAADTLKVSTDNMTDFPVTSSCPNDLAAGASCQVTVNPTTSASYGMILTATAGLSSKPSDTAKAELILSSKHVTTTTLAITPSSSSKVPHLLSQGGQLQYTITNGVVATQPLLLNTTLPPGVSVESDYCTGQVLAPNQSCSVTLFAARHAPVVGVGNITISAFNAKPVNGYFKVQAVPAATTIAVNPSSLAIFYKAGDISKYTITNIGTQPTETLTIQSLLPGDIQLLNNSCANKKLPLKGSCSFELKAKDVTTSSEGRVVISSGNSNKLTVGVAVNPRAPSGQQISLNPTVTQYIIPGTAKVYTVVNKGKDVVTAVAPTVGKLPQGLAVAANNCGLYLSPGKSCQFALYADKNAPNGMGAFSVKGINSNTVDANVAVLSGIAMVIDPKQPQYLNYRAVDVVNNSLTTKYSLGVPQIELSKNIQVCGMSGVDCEGVDAYSAEVPACYANNKGTTLALGGQVCRIWLKAISGGRDPSKGSTKGSLTISAQPTAAVTTQEMLPQINLGPVTLKADLHFATDLYAGGKFEMPDNKLGVARWNSTDGWQSVGFDMPTGVNVQALQLYKGKLYAGGKFYGGFLFSWNGGDTGWTAVAPSKYPVGYTSGMIRALVAYDGKLFIGRDAFVSPGHGLLSWDGSNYSAITSLNGSVSGIFVADSAAIGKPALYIYGQFSSPIGDYSPNFVEYDGGSTWNTDYGTDLTTSLVPITAVYRDPKDGTLYYGGENFIKSRGGAGIKDMSKGYVPFPLTAIRRCDQLYGAGLMQGGFASYTEATGVTGAWSKVPGDVGLTYAILCDSSSQPYIGTSTPNYVMHGSPLGTMQSKFPAVSGDAVYTLFVAPRLTITVPSLPATSAWSANWMFKYSLAKLDNLLWFSWFGALV